MATVTTTKSLIKCFLEGDTKDEKANAMEFATAQIRIKDEIGLQDNYLTMVERSFRQVRRLLIVGELTMNEAVGTIEENIINLWTIYKFLFDVDEWYENCKIRMLFYAAVTNCYKPHYDHGLEAYVGLFRTMGGDYGKDGMNWDNNVKIGSFDDIIAYSRDKLYDTINIHASIGLSSWHCTHLYIYHAMRIGMKGWIHPGTKTWYIEPDTVAVIAYDIHLNVIEPVMKTNNTSLYKIIDEYIRDHIIGANKIKRIMKG